MHFGVPAMAAHLFILYFGILADLTPPVALAAYAAAGSHDQSRTPQASWQSSWHWPAS